MIGGGRSIRSSIEPRSLVKPIPYMTSGPLRRGQQYQSPSRRMGQSSLLDPSSEVLHVWSGGKGGCRSFALLCNALSKRDKRRNRFKRCSGNLFLLIERQLRIHDFD